VHSAVEFIFKYPFLSYLWHKKSNYIASLAVKDENALTELQSALKKQKIRFCAFKEPDIGGQITAIAIEPSTQAQKICSNIPVALKNSSNGINKHSFNHQKSPVMK
jgi:hypothetical protein